MIDILSPLDEGLDRPCGYLMLLNPSPGRGGSLRLYENLRTLAAWLAQHPETWSGAIRGRAWRPTLVGCSAALIVRETRFLDELIFRFRSGSFVSPQLAVALAILHPKVAVETLEATLSDSNLPLDTKRDRSAFAVLRAMGNRKVGEHDWLNHLGRLRGFHPKLHDASYDVLVAENAVQRSWEFWSAHGRNERTA